MEKRIVAGCSYPGRKSPDRGYSQPGRTGQQIPRGATPPVQTTGHLYCRGIVIFNPAYPDFNSLCILPVPEKSKT